MISTESSATQHSRGVVLARLRPHTMMGGGSAQASRTEQLAGRATHGGAWRSQPQAPAHRARTAQRQSSQANKTTGVTTVESSRRLRRRSGAGSKQFGHAHQTPTFQTAPDGAPPGARRLPPLRYRASSPVRCRVSGVPPLSLSFAFFTLPLNNNFFSGCARDRGSFSPPGGL